MWITNKRQRGGFTLLELVIALSMVGITGVISAHFLWPALASYRDFSGQTDAQYLCGQVFQILEGEIRYGKDFRVAGDGRLGYSLVMADGQEARHFCVSRYGPGDLSFIPEGYQIQVSYRVEPDLDQVAVRIAALRMAAGEQTEAYGQTAVIRSFYH